MNGPEYIPGETNSKAEDPWSAMEEWGYKKEEPGGGRKRSKENK